MCKNRCKNQVFFVPIKSRNTENKNRHKNIDFLHFMTFFYKAYNLSKKWLKKNLVFATKNRVDWDEKNKHLQQAFIMRSRLLKFCFVGMTAMILICSTNKVYADCSQATSPGEFCKGLVKYKCRAGCYCTGGTKTSSGLFHAVDVACIQRQTGTSTWKDLNAANIFLCPENFPTSDAGAGAATDCYFKYDNRKVYNRSITCPSGQYLNVDTCTECPADAYCPGGTWVPIKGIQGVETVTCNLGYYLPESNVSCIVCSENNYCAGGVFGYRSDATQGLSVCPENFPTSDAGAGAATDCYFTYDNRKVYNRSITCPSGQYLNVDTCTTCPADAYCPGGTWVPIKGIQGVETVTCNPGYYLPENSTACFVCPENNYCTGGTYDFIPTITQGVVKCPGSAHFSPTGMWKSSQCGYILYIGTEKLYLHQTKDTAPSLNVEVASGIYYANVSKNKKTMNKNSTKYLNIQLRDDIYYVYDDTNL